MASERLAPDAILAQTNLTGAVTDIDEDPDSADASWLTAPGNNNATAVRVSFPTPSAALTSGAGLQEFRVQVRKTNHSTNPTCTIELYENGSLISTLLSGQAVSSTTGVVLSVTWDASGRTASQIECRVSGAVGGGSPGNRASLEVGAIEWNAEVSAATQHDRSFSGGMTPAGGMVRAPHKRIAGTFPSPTYDAAVSGLNPNAYFRMGEASGSVVDSSGGANGTVVGTVTRDVTGLVADDDGAIDFDGSTGYVAVPNAARFKLETTGELSIVASCHPLDGNFGTVVGKANAEQYEYGIGWFNGTFFFSHWAWDGAVRGEVQEVASADADYHLVMTLDETNDVLVAYLNGVEVGRDDTWSGVPADDQGTRGDLEIGRRGDNSLFFDGVIDEVATFPYVLSEAEVASLYAASTGSGGGILGAVSNQLLKLLSIAGSLASAGSMIRRADRVLTAAATSAGALRRDIAVQFPAAVVSMASLALTKVSLRAFTGAIASAGSSTRSAARTLSSSITSSAAVVRRADRSLDGAVASSGSLIRSIGRSLAGAIATAATLDPQRIAGLISRSFSGTVASAGFMTREARTLMASSVASSSTLVRDVARTFAGSVGSSGTATMILTKLLDLAGSITSSGALGRHVAGALSSTVAATGQMARSAHRAVAGTVSGAGVLSRSTVRLLAASVASGGTRVATAVRSLGGAVATSATVTRSSAQRLVGSVASAASLSTQTLVGGAQLLLVSGSVALSGTVRRAVSLRFVSAVLGEGTALMARLRRIRFSPAREPGATSSRDRGSTTSRTP